MLGKARLVGSTPTRCRIGRGWPGRDRQGRDRPVPRLITPSRIGVARFGRIALLAAVALAGVVATSRDASAQQGPPAVAPGDQGLPAVTALRVTDHGGFARITLDLTGPVDFTYGPTTDPTVLVVETRGAIWSFPAGRRPVRSAVLTEYAYVPLSPRHGQLFFSTQGRARIAHITTLDPSQTRGPWRLAIDVTRATGQLGAQRPYGFVNWGSRVRSAIAQTRGFDMGQGGQYVLHRTESFGTGQTRATRVVMPSLAPGGVAANRPEPGRIVPSPTANLPPAAGSGAVAPRAINRGAPVRPGPPRLVTFDTAGAPQPRDTNGRPVAYRIAAPNRLVQQGSPADRQAALQPLPMRAGAAPGPQTAQMPIFSTTPEQRQSDQERQDSLEDPLLDDLGDVGDLYPEEELAGPGIDDPIEGFNRVMFEVNDFLDTWILRPIAWTYGKITPDPLKRGLRNAYANVREPVNLANHLFQLEFTKAAETTGRFLVNSTVGLAGLWDPATDWGLPEQRSDFGHTLYSYDVGSGPYVVLPLLGPSSARDGAGRVVDSFLDPLSYLVSTEIQLGVAGGRAVVERERVIPPLDALKADSIDYYAALRSLWYQNRSANLRRWSGEGSAVPEF